MRQENVNSIKDIIETITIQPDRKLMHLQKEFSVYGSYGESSSISNEMLLQNLQTLIYTAFYCRGENHMENGDPQASLSNTSRREDFIDELRTANTSEDQWNYGWQIETRDTSGAFTAHKGNHTRQIYPGEFIKDYSSHESPQKDESVRIWLRRESDEPSDSFYYAFGNSLAEDDSQLLIRFYFNIVPQGAASLLHGVTTSFNHYLIPFQFKCLNSPELYTRNDAAVLYMNKRYAAIGFSILKSLYRSQREYFKSPIPLFTKKIADGFAFAENPHNPRESFGTSRSKLIASSIVRAFNEQIEQEKWLDSVVKDIEAGGYSLEDFHLNPGSHFPYDFSDLTNYQYAS